MSRDKPCASAQDHMALRAELESALKGGGAAGELAIVHLRLGHLLRSQFLEGVSALKHFQDAFKLDPERLDAVGAARTVYRDLGRLPLVQKLINIEISSVEDVAQAAELYVELGDVLMDQGDVENAAAAYAEAIKGGADAAERLTDASTTESDWHERVRSLVDAASSASPADAARLLVRAAGVVRRYDEADAAEILERAYRADPKNDRVAALFEGTFVESEQAEELLSIQESLISDAGGEPELLYLFGSRWAERHLPEAAAPLLLRALRGRPDRTAAVTFLCVWSAQDEAICTGLLGLAVEDRIPSGNAETLSYLLASAGLVALRDLNNMQQAKKCFDSLAAVAPSHPALAEYRAQAATAAEPSTNIVSIQE